MLEVKVTNYLKRYGIEVKIDSMQNDGTLSWIVISRGINKYVTELPEENGKPSHHEEVALGAGKPVATEQQFTPSSASSSPTIMPIDQRKWNDILAVGNIDELSFKISKQITRLQRHQGHPRGKTMVQLNGEGCCLCFVVITLTHQNVRSKCG